MSEYLTHVIRGARRKTYKSEVLAELKTDGGLSIPAGYQKVAL